MRKHKPRKNYVIFQETKTPKKLLIFRETEPFSLPPENFLYFRKRKPRKIIYISGNGNLEKNPYTSGNGTLLYFGKGIFRTLIYLEL